MIGESCGVRRWQAWAALGLVAMWVTTAGCGDKQAPRATTVLVNGKHYECGPAVGLKSCTTRGQAIFDRYGSNLQAFVDSGRIGSFNKSPVEDAAYAGIIACIFLEDGASETTYIDYMLSNPDFGGSQRVAFLPAWFEAQRSLCPDLAPELARPGEE